MVTSAGRPSIRGSCRSSTCELHYGLLWPTSSDVTICQLAQHLPATTCPASVERLNRNHCHRAHPSPDRWRLGCDPEIPRVCPDGWLAGLLFCRDSLVAPSRSCY